MRLWSLHPKYLDPQGLVALWREGLLAKKVLEGNTKGYKNHPQLDRFKAQENPIKMINLYLHFVCDEAEDRGYSFDRSKLKRRSPSFDKMKVNRGQLDYEWTHLQKKLFKRSRKQYLTQKSIEKHKLHPLFRSVSGGVEDWEVL